MTVIITERHAQQAAAWAAAILFTSVLFAVPVILIMQLLGVW